MDWLKVVSPGVNAAWGNAATPPLRSPIFEAIPHVGLTSHTTTDENRGSPAAHHLCGALFSRQRRGPSLPPEREEESARDARFPPAWERRGLFRPRRAIFTRSGNSPPRGPAAPRGLPATLDSSLRWNDGGTSDLTPAPYSAPDLEALSSQGRRANPHPLPLGTNGYKGQGRTGLGFTL